MAESMRGLHRSHRCTEVSSANIGETVTVMGWVQKRRNLGSLIFIDLRDRSGILQLVFNEETVGKAGYEKAESLRSEYVIAVTGKVEKRSAAVNENLKTGDIEVIAKAQQERQAGKQVLVVRMNKNKKFQKEKLVAEGYKDIVEFFNN